MLNVSIIIVNYNVKHFAEQCLRSVLSAGRGLEIEIFVVDNASIDDSVAYLTPLFPEVQFIANAENIGFGRANNIALAKVSGEYVLILNPDTLLGEDSLRSLVDYMGSHPQIGAAGPKILNHDGSFSVGSHRGFPSPWVAFCKLSGLESLFSNSKAFGRYSLNYLDRDQPCAVDALSGACMMVRRTVYEQVGGFDEDFFMFGEDIDWCYRIQKAGWEVHYAPVTKIVHFKGESTRRSSIDRDRAFYGAMHLFVEKHFAAKYPLIAHRLIDFGIILARAAAKLGRLWRKTSWGCVDWLGFCAVMALGRVLRWGAVGLSLPVVVSLAIQSLTWVFSLWGMGVYGKQRGQFKPILWGMLLGFFINGTFTFFFKQFAYSRFVTLFALAAGGAFVYGWRALLYRFRQTQAYRRFYRRRALIVGTGKTGQGVLKRLAKGDLPYLPVGFVDVSEGDIGKIIAGTPVIGGEGELRSLVRQEEAEEVLFAYETPDYNRVLEVVSGLGSQRGVNFKVITGYDAGASNGLMPLLSVEYLAPRRLRGSMRKITTLVMGR